MFTKHRDLIISVVLLLAIATLLAKFFHPTPKTAAVKTTPSPESHPKQGRVLKVDPTFAVEHFPDSPLTEAFKKSPREMVPAIEALIKRASDLNRFSKDGVIHCYPSNFEMNKIWLNKMGGVVTINSEHTYFYGEHHPDMVLNRGHSQVQTYILTITPEQITGICQYVNCSNTPERKDTGEATRMIASHLRKLEILLSYREEK